MKAKEKTQTGLIFSSPTLCSQKMKQHPSLLCLIRGLKKKDLLFTLQFHNNSLLMQCIVPKLTGKLTTLDTSQVPKTTKTPLKNRTLMLLWPQSMTTSNSSIS